MNVQFLQTRSAIFMEKHREEVFAGEYKIIDS